MNYQEALAVTNILLILVVLRLCFLIKRKLVRLTKTNEFVLKRTCYLLSYTEVESVTTESYMYHSYKQAFDEMERQYWEEIPKNEVSNVANEIDDKSAIIDRGTAYIQWNISEHYA